MDIHLKRMNWPTQQIFFRKTILDASKMRVCSLVDSFAKQWQKHWQAKVED
jgi:hypothetical protein